MELVTQTVNGVARTVAVRSLLTEPEEVRRVNARKLLREAAYGIVEQKPIESVTVAQILREAEVSKQTFYRYYQDKYALVNEIYYDLFDRDVIDARAVDSLDGWRDMYREQFGRFRSRLDFVRHLYTSRETGCTTDFEIRQTLAFDKAFLRAKGVDITDQRILFALEAKDVGGTYSLRDWIVGGMQVPDDEMVTRFELIIPQVLVPYYQ